MATTGIVLAYKNTAMCPDHLSAYDVAVNASSLLAVPLAWTSNSSVTSLLIDGRGQLAAGQKYCFFVTAYTQGRML